VDGGDLAARHQPLQCLNEPRALAFADASMIKNDQAFALSVSLVIIGLPS